MNERFIEIREASRSIQPRISIDKDITCNTQERNFQKIAAEPAQYRKHHTANCCNFCLLVLLRKSVDKALFVIKCSFPSSTSLLALRCSGLSQPFGKTMYWITPNVAESVSWHNERNRVSGIEDPNATMISTDNEMITIIHSMMVTKGRTEASNRYVLSSGARMPFRATMTATIATTTVGMAK